jgi:hypothetical protein
MIDDRPERAHCQHSSAYFEFYHTFVTITWVLQL